MGLSLYDVYEYPIEPCEGCGEIVELEAPETFSSTSYDTVICNACKKRQRDFEDAVEEIE